MPCICCKAALPEGATFCKECKSSQTRWLNWIPQISANMAAITFVLAGIAYVTQVASTQLVAWNAQDRLQIVQVNSRGQTIYLNAGDKDIILLSEELQCVNLTVGRPIYKRAAPSEFVEFGHDVPYRIDEHASGPESPQQPGDMLIVDRGGELASIQQRAPQVHIWPARGTVTFFSTLAKQQKRHVFDGACVRVQPFVPEEGSTAGTNERRAEGWYYRSGP